MVSPATEEAISHLPLTSIRFPLLAPESRFPDNIACCGNRKWRGSGDARVTLVVMFSLLSPDRFGFLLSL